MTLKDLLKTLADNLLVEIERCDGFPIVTIKAGTWRALDESLLSTPVDSIDGGNPHSEAVEIKLSTAWPIIYVSTAEELQAAMDADEVTAIALASDIYADDDQPVLLTFNSPYVKSLDLNGYMMAASNDALDETVIAIKVMGQGALNIYDSEGTGEVFGGKYANCNYALWVDENSLCNIYGGYFTVADMGDNHISSSTIFAKYGDVSIYKGLFENQSEDPTKQNTTLLIDANDGSIECYGGAIVNEDPTAYLARRKRIEKSTRYYDTLYRVVGK